MMESDMNQRDEFLRLAKQLGVRVESPFFVPSAEKLVRFDAFLPDFGGNNGIVIIFDDMNNFAELLQVASVAGFSFSNLNGEASTSESSVKETLDDWGFYGPERFRPEWYTGKPWC